ncbi:unnamed protein product [Caenorhabditis angaria]|uniref:Serum response factor homolog n=1 Tax=Caenorhabditis angaria TaxID=860376 RepID=A0A9P1N500_9PELO|nr:unnamed protein product [Caenorhabditis angaria]
MSEVDDFAQLMQQLQGAAGLPESAITTPAASSTPSGSGLLPNGKKTKGRVKIKMEYINNKLRRYTTFSKRKTGIMKKAFELSTLTGTQVMLLVASETGHVYTYATAKLQPMISSDAGKSLIQACLNAPTSDDDDVAQHSRTEFTFDAGNGTTANMRKRKIIDQTNQLPTVQFPPFLPTMVTSTLFQSFNEDDYNNDDSGDDSDSEEAASDIIKEEEPQPDSPANKKEEHENVAANLQQTLKEALRAAASNRQQQQKKAKMQNTPSKNSFVAPFLLQGLTSTSTNNGTVIKLPQGTVYTNSDDGGANATSLFAAASKTADDVPSNSSNPFLNFPINLQQLMESAALGVQIANAE